MLGFSPLGAGNAGTRIQGFWKNGIRFKNNHPYSLWLFTYSDLKTIVGPKTIFGLCSCLCAEIFGLPSKPKCHVFGRAPLVLLWTWINLLPFAIDNQRQPLAIQEDRINKPWRPMPSGRVSGQQAKQWMLALYPATILFSLYFGGLRQCVVLILLGIWYNDLYGADRNPVIRNLINACGFLSYTSGAMEVAYGEMLPLTGASPLVHWLAVIGGVVATSVQSQDMCDQAGDRVRGRRTLPLVVGDRLSRLSIAVAVIVWSYFGLWFWHADKLVYMLLIGLSTVVAVRTVLMRSVGEDRATFKLWNAWLVVFYSVPLTKHWSSDTTE